MKTVKLAGKILKQAALNYKNNNDKSIILDNLLNDFPESNKQQLIDALVMLKDDDFVSILWADNIPYIVSLNVQGIKNAEVDTLFKKGYDLFKDILDIIT